MQLVIQAVREEAPGVKTFFLAPERDSFPPYRAGQFLTFRHTVGTRTILRSYSLITVPGEDALPAITVRRVPNGIFSRYLCDHAESGHRLGITGPPSGLFTLPPLTGDGELLLLFAGGIGITPVYALLREALLRTSANVLLVYSNSRGGEAVFRRELDDLRTQFGQRLRMVSFASDASDLLAARLTRHTFALRILPLLRDVPPGKLYCFTCGPEGFMWLSIVLCQSMGVSAGRIRREAFVIRKDVPRPEPPDQHARTVFTTGAVGQHHFTAAYPDTILSAARRAGIPLPYSCESGQCGSCAAICREGEVWMSYDEVLTPADRAAGRVLTCTGYPTGGAVTLEF